MGLTSAQGRLLMLTARQSDIQLDEILLSQRQNQLAWQSEKVAKEYNEKMSNMKMEIKVNDSSANLGYTKKDLTYDDMTSMGYLVTDFQNRIYLTKKNGQWVIPTADNLTDKKIFDGNVETDAEGKSTISLQGKKYEVIDATEILSDKTKLQTNLMNGVMFVLNASDKKGGIKVNELESDTKFEWVQDTSDDAEAESKYNYETARISNQDKQISLNIKELETQHDAVTKEMESVQKIIDSNIERTFKLFDGG